MHRKICIDRYIIQIEMDRGYFVAPKSLEAPQLQAMQIGGRYKKRKRKKGEMEGGWSEVNRNWKGEQEEEEEEGLRRCVGWQRELVKKKKPSDRRHDSQQSQREAEREGDKRQNNKRQEEVEKEGMQERPEQKGCWWWERIARMELQALLLRIHPVIPRLRPCWSGSDCRPSCGSVCVCVWGVGWGVEQGEAAVTERSRGRRGSPLSIGSFDTGFHHCCMSMRRRRFYPAVKLIFIDVINIPDVSHVQFSSH